MATKAEPKNDETLDSLEPPVTEYVVILKRGEPDELTLVQKPLTFFGKIEFFSVVGKAVQKVLSEGGSLSELLEVPEYDASVPLASSAGDADVFIKALSRIIEEAPELLLDLYLVILAVPRGQREYVAMRLEDDLTDDQGVKILEVFVDQNWEVMVSFFSEKIRPLFNKVAAKVQA